MASQDGGPAYPLALISGLLILLGAFVRVAAIGVLQARALGMGSKVMPALLRSTTLGIASVPNQVSALIGIMSGLIVLAGALMLSGRVERNVPWGIAILTFSVIGFLGGGGFIIGSFIGMLAGIVAITWTPPN